MHKSALILSAIALSSLLVTSMITSAHPAFAASITKFKIDESAVAKAGGSNHNISLSLEGSFRASEKISTNIMGFLTVDKANYPLSSSVVKIDASGKKISISSKLQTKGSITATMILSNTLDVSKSTTLTSKQGSMVAMVAGKSLQFKDD